jgi:CIC family chloride channel protein
MTALQPAILASRRITGRLLAGIRSAGYLRKWLLLGTVIGVVAGLGAVVFYDGLRLATHLLLTDVGGYTPASTAGEGGFHAASGFSRPWAIPLVVAGGGLLAGLLVFGLAPEAEGHGTDAAIKAVHTNPKGVRPRIIGVKLLASALTIGSGGSGGREGPTAQISSGFGSVLARTLNLTPADSRICVAAGIASGIGAIFRAPFGGALLGVELLYVNDMEVEALVPSLIATVVGYGLFCLITGSFAPVFGLHGAATVSHAWELLLFVPVGLICGVVGKLYTASFYWLTDRFARWRAPQALKPAAAGAVVGLLGLAVPGVLGTGYGELQAQLDLHRLLSMPWWIVLVVPLAKILATGLSIGSGGSGGIFGPGMVIGGATGALLWRLAHLLGLGPHEQLLFVIVGMGACFASIAHAPVAVLVMVAEMTGSLAVLPAAVVAVILAMLVAGDTTIYRSQLGRRSDSPAHRFDFGLSQATAVPVTEVMGEPRLVFPSTTPATEALRRLQEEELPGAPVVNADGAFVGSLQTTALMQLLERRRSGASSGAGGRHEPTAGRTADVEAVTLPADAALDAALDALPASKGGWVPVLGNDMQVLGIISTTDLLRGWRRSMRESMRKLTSAASSSTLVEGSVAPDSVAAGQSVSGLGLPHGAVVLSILREGAFRFPTGDSRLHAGDMVSILVPSEDAGRARALLESTDREPDDPVSD